MTTILTLSKDEVKSLQTFIKTNTQGKPVLRAVIILLLNTFKISSVKRLLGIPERTLYDRINRYKMDKETSFEDKKRPGRPNRWSPFLKKQLSKMVSESPQNYGYCWGKWTCRSLKIHLEKVYGLKTSLENVRVQLIQLGKSWKKPRYMVNSPDPEKEVKLARIEEVKMNLKANEVLLYQDESDFNLFCPLRNCWQDKGQQMEVETPRKNQKVYAFGAYEAGNKRLVYEVHLRKRTTEFLHFLDHLLNVYPDQKVYLVLDNYCVHHSKRTQSFLERNQKRLEFLYLPTYAPKYNPIERVWGTIKDWVNSNHLYTDKAALLRGTRRGLRMYQQEWRSAQAA